MTKSIKSFMNNLIDKIYFKFKKSQGLELYGIDDYELLKSNYFEAVNLKERICGYKKDEMDLKFSLTREYDTSIYLTEKQFLHYLDDAVSKMEKLLKTFYGSKIIKGEKK